MKARVGPAEESLGNLEYRFSSSEEGIQSYVFTFLDGKLAVVFAALVQGNSTVLWTPGSMKPVDAGRHLMDKMSSYALIQPSPKGSISARAIAELLSKLKEPIVEQDISKLGEARIRQTQTLSYQSTVSGEKWRFDFVGEKESQLSLQVIMRLLIGDGAVVVKPEIKK